MFSACCVLGLPIWGTVCWPGSGDQGGDVDGKSQARGKIFEVIGS